MRVLCMSHAYVPTTGAGAETTAHDLLRAVVDAGHTADVLLSENRGPAVPYTVDGVNVWPHVDTGDPFRWFGTPDNSPHVVLGQLQNTNRAAALCRIHRVPLVHVLHNDMEHTKNLIRVGPADLIVHNTEWVKRSVNDWLAANDLPAPPRQMVIHPPVRRDDYRLPAGVKGDRVTLVNCYPAKGAETFYQMAQRFPGRKFLGVIGHYGSQVIRDHPNVDLIGPIPPKQMVEQVYARTKVLLVPSHYESYGRVAIEAACAGIPVIASQAPGLQEALGGDGTFLDPDDYDGWEAELTRVLSPRGWSAASKRSHAVADSLDTAADLDRFVAALEELAKVGVS